MDIICLNNNEKLNQKYISKNTYDLFFEIKQNYSKKIKEIYIINTNYGLVKFDNINNIETKSIDLKNIQTELDNYQLYKKAISLALVKHEKQKYANTLAYFYHLKQTDKVVDSFYSEIPHNKFFITKAAAILHDIIEDCDVTYDDLKNQFNEEIAEAVFRVSKIDEKDTVEYEKEYYKKIGEHDIAIIVKIADKCANTKQTLKNLSKWHANRIINGHQYFQENTYDKINIKNLQNYLDKMVKDLNNKLNN